MRINTLIKYAQWIPLIGMLVTLLYIWYGDFEDCHANDKYMLRYWGSVLFQVVSITALIVL